jgi:hypothetical protein
MKVFTTKLYRAKLPPPPVSLTLLCYSLPKSAMLYYNHSYLLSVCIIVLGTVIQIVSIKPMMLAVIRLIVIMLTCRYAECSHAVCHYADWHYADCR